MKYRITRVIGRDDETCESFEDAVARVKQANGWDNIYTDEIEDYNHESRWVAHLCYESFEAAMWDKYYGAYAARIIEVPEGPSVDRG